MYTLVMKPAEKVTCEAEAEELDFALHDLVGAIELNLPEGDRVKRVGDGFHFNIYSSLSLAEVKEAAKPALDYHWDDIRYDPVKSDQ